ncbi:MAG: hypothetical protein EA365_14510 [Gloeocapsa sp. DLM2.Bin57]|nr:MAG: hypothetical protein EA365_14510 [Gloeocapsa sp. DLM2.Bin57]
MNSYSGLSFLLNPFLLAVCSCLTWVRQPVWADELALPPDIKENSPVLQRWLEKTPDVFKDIQNRPRFSSRFRLGYTQLPSNTRGWLIGVEDVGINRGKLTFSADYQDSVSGDYTALGAQVQYYLLPLGKNVNIAPVLGYRYLQIEDYSTNGANLGARLVLVLSSQGSADLFVTQNFVISGSGEQVGITTVSLGYALTPQVRISTDIEQVNSVALKDTRWGIIIEVLRF